MAENQWSNYQIVTMALYLAGGIERAVHLEKVANRAFEIAPARFSWSLAEYRDRIDKDIVRVSLTDAEKEAKGGYVRSSRDGSGNLFWQLTPNGASFCVEFADKMLDDLGSSETTTRRPKFTNLRNRVQSSDLWKLNERGQLHNAARLDLTKLLRVPPDSSAVVIQREFDGLVTQLQPLRDDRLLSFMNMLSEHFADILQLMK